MEGGAAQGGSFGRGYRGRGGHWRGRAGRKNTTPAYGKGKLNDQHLDDLLGNTEADSVDMTPVRPNIAEYPGNMPDWMVPEKPPTPEPFKFEPPETDQHLVAWEFMQSVRTNVIITIIAVFLFNWLNIFCIQFA